MPRGLSLGKRSRGIAVPCPEGRPRCGPQSGGRRRSQSHCHPAQRKGREGIHRCLDEAPRVGAQHPPWHGVPSPHWLLQSCPSSCPLRTSRKPPFSAFTRSALPCCATWGKCPASSGPQPSNLCNEAGEHWLFSGSLPGVLFCRLVSPGLDLGVTWGGKDLG